jgi:hypothetical protein
LSARNISKHGVGLTGKEAANLFFAGETALGEAQSDVACAEGSRFIRTQNYAEFSHVVGADNATALHDNVDPGRRTTLASDSGA